ncbi:neugrin domain-containing protein [Heterostelium album PN500]|uniref:Neugrin domain-containing protein n=1 Tax=Heterostelium pallidum (strain ATCC 26659 / Pp 5 / PN500) TaxID=670386 RepID=D3BAN4_HETP5|nr:neugrin domain-containing protein [Heterostelium album PN500]EFA81621.1 neugrin domain-containing protein [Heterostelium album PN500]|eukprot:XP_020433738.1 neugrin domain-containing protein [Heterostelium album PN500]
MRCLIPYAQPPVGHLRWSNPTEPVGWDGIRDCSYERESCPQKCQPLSLTCPVVGISEDCLYLTIYTPLGPPPSSKTSSSSSDSDSDSSDVRPLTNNNKNNNNLNGNEKESELRPVLVFIPGSEFTSGSSESPLYDGKQFAENGIILVTVNYRLGILGFLGNKEAGINGNFGFHDQLAALRWVQKNIGAFGGDIKRITLAGQSAGALSVLTHLISPLSNGLFQSVIIQSSPTTIGYHTNATAKEFFHRLLERTNCTAPKTSNFNSDDGSDDYYPDYPDYPDYQDISYERNFTLNCLKELSVNQIIAIQMDIDLEVNALSGNNPLAVVAQWTPMIDESSIPDQPIPMLETGCFNKVNIMLGGDESTIMMKEYRPAEVDTPMNRKSFTRFLGKVFKDSVQRNKIIDLYNRTATSPTAKVSLITLRDLNENDDHRPLLSNILNDLVFICSSRYIVRCISQSKSNNNYNYYNYINVNNNVYYYRYKHANNLLCINTTTCHGDKMVPYIFNSFKTIGLNISDDDRQMGEHISKYWTNFVTNQNPNLGYQVPIHWSKYTENSYQNNVLIFDTNPFADNIDNDIPALLFWCTCMNSLLFILNKQRNNNNIYRSIFKFQQNRYFSNNHNNNNFVNDVSFTIKPTSDDTRSTVLKMMEDLENNRNKKKQIKKNTPIKKIQFNNNNNNNNIKSTNQVDNELDDIEEEYDDEEFGLVDNELYDEEYEQVERANTLNSKQKQQFDSEQQLDDYGMDVDVDDEHDQVEDDADDGVYLFDENQKLADTTKHDQLYDEYGMEGMEDYEFDNDNDDQVDQEDNLTLETEQEMLDIIRQSEEQEKLQKEKEKKPTRAEKSEQHKNLEAIIKNKYGDKANKILHKILIKEKYGNWEPIKKLSRDQMSEIKRLHKEDPDIHTVESLVTQYRVSKEAIKRIIRSNWTPSEDRLKEQDSKKKHRLEVTTESNAAATKGTKRIINNNYNNNNNKSYNDNKPTREYQKSEHKFNQTTQSSPKLSYNNYIKKSTNLEYKPKTNYNNNNSNRNTNNYNDRYDNNISITFTNDSLHAKMKRLQELSSKIKKN